MNLKNTDIKVAVNAIIGSMVQNGYNADGENGMLVTVRNENPDKAARLRNEILTDIDASLTTNNVSASIINQTLSSSADAQTFATQNNISVGKAVFVINLAAKDKSLEAVALAKMSIREIAELVAKNGINIRDIVDYDADDSIWENIADTIEDIDETAPTTTNPPASTNSVGGANSPTAKITAAKAKEIARNHAGITAANATFIKAQLDYDDGMQTYEVEFYSGRMEYEYEINAVSGAIISHSAEMDD